MGLNEEMGRLYHEWGILAMVVLRVVMQVILQLFGFRRKNSPSAVLRNIVLCCYSSANPVAIMALGMIWSKVSQNELGILDGKTKVNALWAPFLLVLLGGSDSITSYSVQDNQGWLTQFGVFVIKTVLTGRVCFLAWEADCVLSYLSLLILVVGMIMFGERVRLLRNASSGKMREELYSVTTSMNNVGWCVRSGKDDDGFDYDETFRIIKKIILKQTWERHECADARRMFVQLTPREAFNVIEIQLGFMFDILHTTAETTFTRWGIRRRLMTISISCIVLPVFSGLVIIKKTTSDYPIIDVAVTLVFLATSVSLEIYWVWMLLSSDWAQLISRKTGYQKEKSCLLRIFNCMKNKVVVRNTNTTLCNLQPPRRWTNSAGQLSFFSWAFEFDCSGSPLKRLHLRETVGPYYYTQHQHITDYIKEHIFVVTQVRDSTLFTDHVQLIRYQLKDVPQPLDLDEELQAALRIIYGFEYSITVWHIATELCYYYDLGDHHDDATKEEREAAVLLSRYMFYLLVRYPLTVHRMGVNNMLNRLWDEVDIFLKKQEIPRNQLLRNKSDVEKMLDVVLQQTHYPYPPTRFHDACSLAKTLMAGSYKPNAWRFLFNTWLAHLYYAAYNCRNEHHIEQLGRGGELLTHTWMLMVHSGFADHTK